MPDESGHVDGGGVGQQGDGERGRDPGAERAGGQQQVGGVRAEGHNTYYFTLFIFMYEF